MSWLEWFELGSYLVTIIGLPFAILVYLLEQRRERKNEAEEIYQRLSDEYREFLKLVLDNADLQLLRQRGPLTALTEEQNERKQAIFGILIAIFERSYLLVYEEHMDRQTRRLWQSWEDYMRDWCKRDDFRALLPSLLEGEDDEFREHIARIASESVAAAGAESP
jgi:hypothetical protein